MSTPSAASSRPARLAWPDIYRGAAIIAVVFIHVRGRFYDSLPRGSAGWWVYASVVAVLDFAVPAFLALSTAMNAAALARRPGAVRFWRSRLVTVLWPYLLWSCLYLAVQTPRQARGNWGLRNPGAVCGALRSGTPGSEGLRAQLSRGTERLLMAWDGRQPASRPLTLAVTIDVRRYLAPVVGADPVAERRRIGERKEELSSVFAGAFGVPLRSAGWAQSVRLVLIGKAAPHLYFLWLLLQLLVILPLLSRAKPGVTDLARTLALGLLLTLGFAALNRACLTSVEEIGRSILKYGMPIALGLWMAGRLEGGVTVPQNRRVWLAAAFALSVAAYLPTAAWVQAQRQMNTLLHAAIWSLFVGLASVSLFWIACSMNALGRPARALQALGARSLQIYLAHPLALAALDRFPGATHALGPVGGFLLYGISCLALPMGLAWVSDRVGASRLLFGRSGATQGGAS